MRSNLKKALLVCIILAGLVVGFIDMGEDQNATLDKLTNEWISCYNTEPEKLSAFYHDNALLFPDKNDFIQGNTLVAGYYQENAPKYSKIQTVTVQKRIKVRDNIVYELSELITEKEGKLQQLIIWQEQNNKWQRLLEGVSKKTLTDNPAANELDAALNSWVTASKSVPSLVNNLYTDNAVYCSPPMINKGKKEITSAYSLMFQPGTALPLTTVALTEVTDDLAYEIGQYAAAVPGYYVLIWQKDSGWKVRLDSNM